MNTIAFLTVIFKTDERFLYDFFESLAGQTVKSFDVIVINDGYPDLGKFVHKFPCLNIIEVPCTLSPAKNREFGIRYVLNKGYKSIVFGDCDDFFSENRVECLSEILKTYDLVVNDISTFDVNGVIDDKYISNRMNNFYEVSLDDLLDKNFMGLSNTALNTNILKDITIPKDIMAVDWYIFSILLFHGARSVFTNKCLTWYRQHENNLIGIKQVDKLKKNADVKKMHYDALMKYDILFSDMLVKHRNKDSMIEDNVLFPLWWEEI